MDTTDPIFLKIFSSHPLLSGNDAKTAESWWLVEKKPKETVVEFLIRMRVFSIEAPRTIDLLRRGVLTYVDTKRIFGDRGHQVLRDYGKLLGLPSSPPGQPKSGGLFTRPSGNLTKSDRISAAASLTTSKSGTLLPTPQYDKKSDSSGNLNSGYSDQINELRSWMNKRVSQKSAPLTSGTSSAKPVPKPITSVHDTPLSSVKESQHTSGNSSRAITISSQNTPVRAKFPSLGDQIGKYLLTEEVGRGGSAVVFRALNKSLNSVVALKVIRAEKNDIFTDDQADQLEGLKREAQLLARFNHVNLVRVFDFESEHEYPFIVLEFVDGLGLDKFLGHCGRIRPDKAVKMVEQIASGLYSAQEKIGLVHRDIKPGNILLSKDGLVKLADLGLALMSDDFLGRGSVTNKEMVGTAAYMAPEQANMEEVDHRADIYSLGASFYHALVGQMPFKGKTRMELILKHTKEDPIPPHDLVAGLSPRFSEVLLKMMKKKPSDRYQGYEELLLDLEALYDLSRLELKDRNMDHISALSTANGG